MSNIREAIRLLAQDSRHHANLICVVDAVDKQARTVDCTPLDESAPLLGVNLQANQGSSFGLVTYPKVGSYIVVGFVADGAAGVVLLTDEVDSIELVISGDTSRIMADKGGVRMIMGDDIDVTLSKEGITLNGGSFGGIIKVEPLTQRLNTIENDINALKTVFSTWVPIPQDGGASLAGMIATWARSILPLTKRTDYENKKVQHG